MGASSSTARAMEELAPILKDDMVLISLQNGLGNYEIMKQAFPTGTIAYGVTSMGASLQERTVVFGGAGSVLVGSTDESILPPLMELFEKSSIEAAIVQNPDEALWTKAIVNSAVNPLGALLGVPNGALIKNKDLAALQGDIIAEAVRAARATGILLSEELLKETTRTICGKTATNLCSMLQDISAGRTTEIEEITGKIIEAGQEGGLSMEVNQTLFRLIKAREALNREG